MSKGFKIATWVVAALLGVLGVRWMLTPQAMAATLGISLRDALALNTARGDMGGLFIAGAILCAFGVINEKGHWLQAVALVIGCVAVGRTIGLLLDGFAAMSLISILVEIAMVVVLTGAARQARGPV